jgi:Protein of unknown function with PCYCGC motif
MPDRPPKLLILALVSILVVAALPACSTPAQASGLHMMPMDRLPANVQAAPSSVRLAYQFAAANPDVMQQIPCYCGCGSIGHTSNYSCYVLQADANGVLTYDPHALGCSICVDITQDVMRLLKDGKTVPEIRSFVDATYSKYGTSNMPPLPGSD